MKFEPLIKNISTSFRANLVISSRFLSYFEQMCLVMKDSLIMSHYKLITTKNDHNYEV